MTTPKKELWAIERDGTILNQIVFIGRPSDNFRPTDVVPMTFENKSTAEEVCRSIGGTVVEYGVEAAAVEQPAKNNNRKSKAA